MAAKKIKFELNITGLSIKFEGDYEQGQKVQQGFASALGQLTNMQGSLLGLEEQKPTNTIDGTVVVERSARRRRRRASKNGVDASAETAELPLAEDEAKETERRSSGASPTALLIQLKGEGFFAQGKTVGEIVAEAQRRGHTRLAKNSFTAALQRYCQSQFLNRTKDAHLNVWVYTAGPNDG